MQAANTGLSGGSTRQTGRITFLVSRRLRANRPLRVAGPGTKELMMSELQPTVFIIDGDTRVQQTLRRLFESVRLRVETYATTRAFLESYDPSRPGCLILEVRMRDVSGIELHRRLREEGNRIPVIFLTEHGDVPMAVQAMREGAFHFLQKPVNEQYLLDQTHAALVRDMRDRQEDRERRAAAKRFEGLSGKERDVLMEIVAGKRNKEMAGRFGVTVKTVEFHRANIMKKVGAESAVELVYYLLKSGWNPRPERDGNLRPGPPT